jgi:hypothetical protein
VNAEEYEVTQPISGAAHGLNPKVRDVTVKIFYIENFNVQSNEIKKSKQSGRN